MTMTMTNGDDDDDDDEDDDDDDDDDDADADGASCLRLPATWFSSSSMNSMKRPPLSHQLLETVTPL